MEHKFDFEAYKKLGNEERLRLLMPHETLEKLGFADGKNMADIGCGTGVFSLPAAKLSPNGHVYAIDISQDMLDALSAQARAEGLENITALRSEEYDVKLGDDTADFVLICTVLHEIDDKVRLLSEASRICTEGGTVTVVEFNESFSGFGPPASHRLPRDLVKELLSEAGMSFVRDMDISEAFYAVTARRETRPVRH